MQSSPMVALSFPSQPPTLPVLGNLLDVPAKNAHLMFTELGVSIQQFVTAAS